MLPTVAGNSADEKTTKMAFHLSLSLSLSLSIIQETFPLATAAQQVINAAGENVKWERVGECVRDWASAVRFNQHTS